MKTRPFVKLRLPFSFYDTDRLEQWLEENARAGLLLQKRAWGLRERAQFQRSAPAPQRRYRLCPARDHWTTHPTSEQLELYEASGWHYVCSFHLRVILYHVFYSDDTAAPEPYNDADSLRMALHFPIAATLLTLLLLSALIALRVYQFSIDPRLTMDPKFPSLVFILVLFCLLSALCALVDWTSALLFRHRLRDATRPHVPLPQGLAQIQRILSAVAPLICTAYFLLFNALILMGPRDLPLSEWEPDFPLVTLAQMEEGGNWTPDEDYILHYPGNLHLPETIHRNVVSVERILPPAPIHTHYRIDQSGSGSNGDADMKLDYYVSWSERGAVGYLDRLVQYATGDRYYPGLPTGLPFRTIPVAGAEEFLYRREGTRWEPQARREERVLSLSYSGSLNLADWFHDIAAMLTSER